MHGPFPDSAGAHGSFAAILSAPRQRTLALLEHPGNMSCAQRLEAYARCQRTSGFAVC